MTVAIQQLIWRVENIRDAFHQAVFVDRDVDAAMTAAGADCTLDHSPMGTGAGPDGLRGFLTDDVLPHLPTGLTFQRVTRTADQRRVVQEDVVSFTHDRPLPWLLPGSPRPAATSRCAPSPSPRSSTRRTWVTSPPASPATASCGTCTRCSPSSTPTRPSSVVPTACRADTAVRRIVTCFTPPPYSRRWQTADAGGRR